LTNDIRKEDLCLQDIIDKAISLSGPACKLEIENNKAALEELKKGAREIRDLGEAFYHRLKNEVQPEVIAYHVNKQKAAPRGKNIQETLNEQNKSNNN